MGIELRMRDINLTSILFVIAVITSRQYAYGLKCYVCQGTSGSSSCIMNPDSSSTCESKYCTIYRRELAEPEGIVTGFYRACENTPLYLNTKIKTPYATTYYRACEIDLCNTGDGTTNVTTAVPKVISTDGDSIVVPGLGATSDASCLHFGTVCAFVLVIVTYATAMFQELRNAV